MSALSGTYVLWTLVRHLTRLEPLRGSVHARRRKRLRSQARSRELANLCALCLCTHSQVTARQKARTLRSRMACCGRDLLRLLTNAAPQTIGRSAMRKDIEFKTEKTA